MRRSLRRLQEARANSPKGVSRTHRINKQRTLELGQIVATPGALAVLEKAGQQPGEFPSLHVNREWGDLSDEDRKENDYSLEHGFRLLSRYRTNGGETTLLLPEEY